MTPVEFCDDYIAHSSAVVNEAKDILRTIIADHVAAEREGCAMVADKEADEQRGDRTAVPCERIAAKIRARK